MLSHISEQRPVDSSPTQSFCTKIAAVQFANLGIKQQCKFQGQEWSNQDLHQFSTFFLVTESSVALATLLMPLSWMQVSQRFFGSTKHWWPAMVSSLDVRSMEFPIWEKSNVNFFMLWYFDKQILCDPLILKSSLYFKKLSYLISWRSRSSKDWSGTFLRRVMVFQAVHAPAFSQKWS